MTSSTANAGARKRVLHLMGNEGPHPIFNCWADFGDHAGFDYTFGCLRGEGAMHVDLAARGHKSFALHCFSAADRFKAIPALVRRLRSERIDILQTHLFEAALVGSAAARLAGTPLVVFTGHHSHEASVVKSWKFRLADGLAAGPLCDGVFAHSQDMKNIFVRYEHVDPAKIALVNYPFDFREWKADPQGAMALRAELGIPADAMVWGAVGRLYWIKDHSTMIEGFARIAVDHPKAHLMIVGTGGDKEALESLARSLGVQSQVHFAGQRKSMTAVYSAMDVFLHTAIAESFCQSLVEAFALGKPAIASGVGIAPEIVVNGQTGQLFAPKDVRGLTAALRTMIAARSRWHEMGQAGRRKIEPFAAQTIIPKFEAQYRRWLEVPRRFRRSFT